MKLEFLAVGSDDCPLVRVYDFTTSEVARLFAAFSSLASGGQQSIAVHESPGTEAVSGCRLFLRAGTRDRGLVQLPGPASFECILTPESWDNVAGLTEPFVAQTGGYQWLSTTGDANWLLSENGQC
jgi:hypothetical protein